MLMRLKINWDALGVTTSVLCAIHCAVLPLLIASLPILGINIIDNPSFEYGMIGVAFLIGSRALWHGFHKHHRHPGPWRIFAGGMILLLAKQVWDSYEFLILPFAVLLILIAHGWNYRLCRTGARPEAAGS
jgi:hypothetical protein